MASDVDIVNVALAYLGDDATVASIDPPEGSAQATHCARFYPIARAALQDMNNWGFCTTRASLSLLAVTPISGWLYAYGPPSDAINILSVFLPSATDDYNPQQFDMEQLPDGTHVIYTNVVSAVCRYTRHITDPSSFPPLFVDCLSWLLAAYLAGPILKGEAGRAAAIQCFKMFEAKFADATASDAAQRRVQPTQNVAWVTGR